MQNYIAIEVSKKELVVFDGQRLCRFENSPSLRQFRGYLERNFRIEETVVVFEPSGPYSLPLAQLVSELSLRAYIVNPAQVRWFSKAMGKRRKADEIDVRVLYEFGRFLQSKGVEPVRVCGRLLRLQQLLSSWQHLKKLAQALRNHAEAIGFSRDRDAAFTGRLMEEASRLEEMAKEALEEAKGIVREDRQLREGYEAVKTTPGIAERTALVLCWFFATHSGVNRKQIAALCGLDVRQDSSGSSVRSKARISKQGNAAVRAALYMPALVAIRYNPAIRTFYQRLIAKGKKPKAAVVACMRKLLLIAYAVWRSRQRWQQEVALRSNRPLPLDSQDSI